MNKSHLRIYGLAVLSAIFTAIALVDINNIVAWFAPSFLLYSLYKEPNLKPNLICAILFGAVSSAIVNFWMITVVHRYAQGSLLIGIACWLASIVFMGLVYAVIVAVFSKFKIPGENNYSYLINSFFIASLWVIAEWIRSELLNGMPWVSYSMGITQSSSLYLAQLAAIGGVFILSFLVIFCNSILAYIFIKKDWRLIGLPTVILGGGIFIGYLQYNNISKEIEAQKLPKVKAALILPSLQPETVWDETNGNKLIENYLTLNDAAIKGNPDLILWSESAIPWTYRDDDDFLAEISKATSSKNIYYLLGMNTSADPTANVIHNSAYFFHPSGKLLERYDKQKLLTLVEKPLFTELGSLILPFLSNQGLRILPGKSEAISTPWGKAGILICNESTISSAGLSLSKQDVSFIVNMANNSWFYQSIVPKQHFYNSRLRAIETRKDVVINNNMGTSGVIRANGDVKNAKNNNESRVEFLNIQPNKILSMNHIWFVHFLIIATLLFLLISLYRAKVKASGQKHIGLPMDNVTQKLV